MADAAHERDAMAAPDVDVAVIGYGPVGAMLANLLGMSGLSVVVLEREASVYHLPRAVSADGEALRLFQTIGLADELLPRLNTSRNIRHVNAQGQLLLLLTRAGIGPEGWNNAYRFYQPELESILRAGVARFPQVDVRLRADAFALDEHADHVCVRFENLASGALDAVTARYVIGCDGARSIVRKAIGAELAGDAVVQRVQSTYIRAPSLIGLQRHERAWGTGSINPRRSGMVYAIDGRERWLLHNYMKPGEGDFDEVDRDASLRTILGVEADFKYEIISNEDWYGRRLIANRFRDRCAFIAGDAAHIWVPYAGYGMNAGIADAMNLSWLLAAHLNGWAPPAILDAYEAERWPITSQVSRFAMSHAEAEIRRRGSVPGDIEQAGPEGERARHEVGRLTYEINVQQYACAGLNFGTYYDQSPIIAYDGAAHPAYTMNSYTPSTVPGCRTPHLWCKDGRSLYDAMGPEFTLLRFDPATDVAALDAAARLRGLPLKVLDVERPDSAISDGSAIYDGDKLVLSRPDQHVAWRSNKLPADSLAMIDRVRGAAIQARRARF